MHFHQGAVENHLASVTVIEEIINKTTKGLLSALKRKNLKNNPSKSLVKKHNLVGSQNFYSYHNFV
jgi:hypothetical protein